MVIAEARADPGGALRSTLMPCATVPSEPWRRLAQRSRQPHRPRERSQVSYLHAEQEDQGFGHISGHDVSGHDDGIRVFVPGPPNHADDAMTDTPSNDPKQDKKAEEVRANT